MPVFPFGEWLPDQAAYRNAGVTVATNVLPSASGYLPVPGFVATTNALDTRPRGAIRARDTDGNAFEFAGDALRLYQDVGDVWTDRSKTGGYATGERWEFLAWKNKILATNFSDSPQQITFGAAAFSDLTTAFRARHIAAIRDFVVVGNTFDATDGGVPSRVRWSAFNNETDWTVSPATLSDFQDLKVGGVERILGGEFGVVFQADSVWRMTFVGAPVVFQFDEVLPGIGTIAPGAVVRDGATAYFLSSRGFFALVNGSQATPIGANKVDRFVLDDLDVNFLDRISATVDPGSHRVLWAYPGAGNVNGRPNRIVVYDPSLDRWSLIEQELELIWSSGGTATTLEQLDSVSASIDDLETSLDSQMWSGSGRLLAAFNAAFENGNFGGDPMAATIESQEVEIHSGARARLNAFRPLVEGGAVTAQVGTRNRQSDPVTFGAVLSQRASGRFTTRANARYHRVRLNLSGAWERAIGIQIERDEAKRGGRRG
jgi:hypothetical protein